MTNHMDAQKEIIEYQDLIREHEKALKSSIELINELEAQKVALVEALRYADIFLTEFKEYGDAWDINKHNALRKIRIALAQVGE